MIFMHRENASKMQARHPPQHRPEVSGPAHWSHLLWRKAREPQRKKTKREERQVVVPTNSACWALWGLWQRPQEEICRNSYSSLLQFSSQIHSHWLGDIVDFGIGLLTLSPQSGTMNFGYRFTMGNRGSAVVTTHGKFTLSTGVAAWVN